MGNKFKPKPTHSTLEVWGVALSLLPIFGGGYVAAMNQYQRVAMFLWIFGVAMGLRIVWILFDVPSKSARMRRSLRMLGWVIGLGALIWSWRFADTVAVEALIGPEHVRVAPRLPNEDVLPITFDIGSDHQIRDADVTCILNRVRYSNTIATDITQQFSSYVPDLMNKTFVCPVIVKAGRVSEADISLAFEFSIPEYVGRYALMNRFVLVTEQSNQFNGSRQRWDLVETTGRKIPKKLR